MQKLTTDFGAECPFGQTVNRLKEHHGIELAESTARRIVQRQAYKAKDLLDKEIQTNEESSLLTIEMDGSMIPTVSFENAIDKRKARRTKWEEIRVAAAQKLGQATWHYATSFENTDHLGERLKLVLKGLGFTERTQVYGRGDGACWIVEQGERIAGNHFSYLIDLFHLCDYFSKAYEGLRLDPKVEVEICKELAKEGRIEEVLKRLKDEQELVPSHKGLKDCIRYIENRPGQFDYQKAKVLGLPMGSGKIESTHRSLIQKRLKIPGAWWLKENASAMADLRTLRANNQWELLWEKTA